MAMTDIEIFEKLFTKLGAAVSVGETTASGGEGFLVLANPGILIDPGVDLTDKSDQRDLSLTLDRVLAPNWIYQPREMQMHSLYYDFLLYSESPIVTLTSKQKEQLEYAKKIIYANNGDYSDTFLDYRKYKTILNAAFKAITDIERSGEEPDDVIWDQLENAQQDFALQGNAGIVEPAIITLKKLEALESNAWQTRMFDLYEKGMNRLGGETYPDLRFYPRYDQWTDEKRQWSSLTLNEKDLEKTTTTSHTKVGGGAGARWGLWHGRGNYSQETIKLSEEIEATSFNIKTELLRVEIIRPYLDTKIFYSDAWQFVSSGFPYKERLVSDGADAAVGTAPKGLMPFVPTGLLIARNTSITGSWSKDLHDYFEKVTQGGMKVGWGPFSASGNYYNRETRDYIKASSANAELTISSPQIIGFFTEVLPKSPNPHPDYIFPSDRNPLILSGQNLLDAAAAKIKLRKKC